MLRYALSLFIYAVPLLLFSSSLWGFGKNKLINKDFFWQIKTIPHFDVYYYGVSGKALLPYAELYLESAYKRVTKTLPNTSENKIFPFFLYNNHNDFEQTNITQIGEGTGGVTEAFKDRLVVGNIGSQRYLEYVIAHEFSHEIEFAYFFEGFWRSIRLLKFIFYPSWLMEGLAEYSAGDLDSTTREMYLRDATVSKKLLPVDELYNFNHVLPHQVTLAYKESEALMHYIAEEYGSDKLHKLLISYVDRFDPSSVLEDVIGTDLPTIDRKFIEFMEDKYALSAAGLSEPWSYGKQLTVYGQYPSFYESAVFSPDEQQIAFISDKSGAKDVYLMDLAEKKPSRLWDLHKSAKIENINPEGNGLSFSPKGDLLVFCGEEKQKDYLYIYEINARKLKKIDTKTETTASPAFSIDGSTIYFSGILNGFRDLFAYKTATGEITQLTKTAEDEIDAVISPDGNYLYYSAEAKNPKGRTEYDICRMDLNTLEVWRITSLDGDERYPFISKDSQKLYFTSDQDGINNIYAQEISSGRIKRLTQVLGGNFQPKVSPDGKKLLFSSFRKGEKHLYLADISKLEQGEWSRGRIYPTEIVGATFMTPANTGLINQTPTSRPYRFHASTDLFFPAIYYSSIEGLFLAAYWQASDFLGNHQLQSQVSYASGSEYLDFRLTYAYLRFRPQFYFSFVGQQYYYDFDQTIKRKAYEEDLAVSYPLNRFQRLELILATIDRAEEFKIFPSQNSKTRENTAGLSFFHDTTEGPYMELTKGMQFQLTGQFSDKALGGDYVYQTYLSEAREYFPVGKEHVIVSRIFAGQSSGPDARQFRLGGEDRVRAVSQNQEFYGKGILLSNLEWRFPIVHNINYHMWYFFPDFFFKSFYGALFVDSGVVWNDETQLRNIKLDTFRSSYGVGLRFSTFILEMAPLFLNFQLARQMNDQSTFFYFTAMASF